MVILLSRPRGLPHIAQRFLLTSTLYNSQKESEWSLFRVKAILLDETQIIHAFITKIAPREKLQKECLGS